MQRKYLAVFLVLGIVGVGCAHTGGKTCDEKRNPASTDSTEDTSETTLSETGKTSAKLENCSGTANLRRNSGKLTLEIRGTTCGTVRTAFGDYQMNGTGNSGRYKDIQITETPGRHTITVGSRKWMESNGYDGMGDAFYVQVAAKASPVVLNLKRESETDPASLGRCNGTVRGKIKNNQLYIIFSETTCRWFDILSNDGSSLSYDEKEIPKQGQKRGGSMAIPPKFMDSGSNGVVLRVYNSYDQEAKILVKFFAY